MLFPLFLHFMSITHQVFINICHRFTFALLTSRLMWKAHQNKFNVAVEKEEWDSNVSRKAPLWATIHWATVEFKNTKFLRHFVCGISTKLYEAIASILLKHVNDTTGRHLRVVSFFSSICSETTSLLTHTSGNRHSDDALIYAQRSNPFEEACLIRLPFPNFKHLEIRRILFEGSLSRSQ